MGKQGQQVTGKDARIQAWLEKFESSSGALPADCVSVNRQALALLAGDPSASDATLELLTILRGLAPDPRTLSTALLFMAHVVGNKPLPDDISPAIQSQLDDLLRLHRYETEQAPGSSQHRAEGLRRLLLALVKDVRVVLIAIAWQLVRLRQAGDLGQEQQQELAHETLLIHAPLANRLGVWQLKWELEDLAFRYQHPDDYQRVAKLLAEKRSSREGYIDQFMHELGEIIETAGIESDIKGRPKHIYSIWRKMQAKGLDYHELFDIRAVRVLVREVADCYAVLGLVHTHWQPVPGEFDDYITTPKGNMYQSLHTAVVGEEGKTVEVQIRTWAMHEHAELGVAAHWRYKEGGARDPAFDQKVLIMRQLLDAGEDGLDDASLLESFSSLTSEDRVYALTPGGDVVDLSAGSTVLDFAYAVHTEVGHRCRGAKINGRIVPLTQAVATGDRVEILTARQARPSRDWLNPRQGYIHGARARSKVRQWFRRQNLEQNLEAGREMLHEELSRLGLDLPAGRELLDRYNFQSEDEVYVALGNGDLTVNQVVGAIERFQRPAEVPLATELKRRRPPEPDAAADDIVIDGVGNLMTSMARCCRPLPGDEVRGYITRGRGVTIHRADCRHLLNLRSQHPHQVIEVQWGQSRHRYTAVLNVEAWDRKALLKDISTVLSTENVTVMDFSSHRDPETDQVHYRIAVQIQDLTQLSGLLARLNAVENVIDARRQR